MRVVIDRPGALFLSEPAFLVFVTRTVGLTPFQVGLVFSASGAGAFAGALAATRAADRLGVPLALTGSLATAGAASAIVPAAAMAPQGLAPALIAVAHFVMSATVIVFNVTQRSLRTSLTPADLYGRMNASIRMIVMGAAPVGGLLGGWLSATAGPRAALVVGALGMATACAWLRPFRPAGRDGTGAGTGPSIPAPRRESAPPASGPLPGRRRQDRTAADGHGRGSPSA
ncbi:MFS transporter [Streptomyces sp. AM6-12]|uniref:MFS transporter n=1 Tax=Streptomyces sp. AM6-12 TaxID=3345149 RepID=UPI0037AA6A9A